MTIRAAERGKHILCEKPLGLNAAEVRKMTAACAANHVTLMEAFMYRYNRPRGQGHGSDPERSVGGD